ncbi:MAG: phospho-sugar mutase [Candidatus Atribacteria bacterium]|nr:phospho-sugar mutase [Candidatus Atribacteria bacterium]
MNTIHGYQDWLNSSIIDIDTKKELLRIKGNQKEIEDRFYKELSFGTGGLRGIVGAGTNRLNIYTIRKITQGLANYIKKNQREPEIQTVVIAYDCRHDSDTFALEAALVLAANDIKAYLFDSLRPTPELSYAVRHLKCSAGIVITASHNPPKYNGYKVYGSDGGQITLNMANGIIQEIGAIDLFSDVKTIDQQEAMDKNLLVYIGAKVDRSYLSEVVNLSFRKEIAKQVKDFRIVYTPLHGTGLMLIKKALKILGYRNVYLVKSQINPDGNFPTVKSPNPEEREALAEGIKLAQNIDADLVLGTDPDGDRVGIAAKTSRGIYQVLTGNQVGALLTNYIVTSKKRISSKDAVIKTIVTSDLGAKIAESYGATVFNTLTGFKFIGEKMKEFEESQEYIFLFGYEESYGYLAGTFVRDKDAVIASILITEMTAYYQSIGMTLFDVLEKIYREYGYYSDFLESLTFNGKEGQEKIKEIYEKFRNKKTLLKIFHNLECIEDYQSQVRITPKFSKAELIDLPKAEVIKVFLKDGSWFAVRPSGTEPKLKIYYSTIGNSSEKSKEILDKLKQKIQRFLINAEATTF